MELEVRHSGLRNVLEEDVRLERIATGFLFTEGPVWHPHGRHLTFSDVPGDAMHRWSEEEELRIFRQPSRKGNGNAYDGQGRLITCEHATSRVVREERDGSLVVLASHYEDQELNSPNDVVAARDGSIYFSDPVFGRREFFGVPRPQQLSFQAVYRIAPEGRGAVPVADDFDQPNGLCLSDDETVLLVNDTPRRHIRRFEVGHDGALHGGGVWAEVQGDGEGVPDGLKMDSAGRVFCTGPGGIHVFDPEGLCLGVIRVPEKTANFAWGGEDLRTLFITASTSLYRLRLSTPGRPAF